MRKGLMLSAALALGVAMVSFGGAVPADARAKCRTSQQYVKGFGCVRKAEIRKARRTCSKLKPPASFRECLCSDGGNTGACGD